MSIGVFLMVLCAAAVHATWNALVKSDEDRLGLIRVMFLTQFAFSLSLVPFVVLPDRESWPYLCASAVLGAGYMVFLNWAYRVGDLSHVYPFARGIAPLIVAIVSTAFLGEQISEAGKIAVVLIALGIASLASTRGAAGLREPRPIFLSFIAGGFCRRVHNNRCPWCPIRRQPEWYCQLKRPWYARRVGGAAARVGELRCSPIMLPRSSRAGPEKGAPSPLS